MNLFYVFDRFKRSRHWPELILALSLIISLCCLDLSWFNTHMSRDLSRAFEWIHLSPSSWLGPEMGWDFKRLPGPFYYILLAIFWLISPSVEGLLFLKICFSAACIFFLLKELKKIHSVFFVSLFSIQFVFMPVYIATIRNIWNPSLIVAFSCLIFLCALKYMSKQSDTWIWICSAVAALGLQIHFSLIVPYLAFIFSVLFFKKKKKIILMNILLFSFWIFSWLYFNPAPEFNRQLQEFYGLNKFLLHRFQDFSFHLSLSLKPITDYDLFYMLTKAAVRKNLISSVFVDVINPIFNMAVVSIFIFSFLFLIYRFIKTKEINFIEAFSILWMLFFVISYVVTKHKEQLPYRYGLCLYPVQFYLLCLAVSFFKKYVQKVIILFLLVVSCSHIYFIYHFYIFQDVFGRTHHTHQDTLELTLKNKKYIYNFLNPVKFDDPLSFFHGRSINKMRLKEMNWEQTKPYFSLYESLTGNKVQYDLSKIIRQLPSEAWLYQLKSFHQNFVREDSAFDLKKMDPAQLPHQLVLKYLGSDGSQINSVEWRNTNLIMPLAFLESNQKSITVRLEFDVDSLSYKYLNILVDDNAYYKFAYQTQFEMVSVKLNSENINPSQFYSGHFLVQNQYIYKIPDSVSKAHITVDLKVSTMLVPNFSRIDIFTTPNLLDQEELDENSSSE